ncbi:MAG: hypothetical protein AB8B96_01840 [Lysobacterales bacterium]
MHYRVRRPIGQLFLLTLTVVLSACTYRGYNREVNPSERFLIEARNGAVLGEHKTSTTGSSHSYYSRGEFAAGQSTFHAATEIPGAGLNDEGDDDREFVNLREIQFSGIAGAKYWLLPRNQAGNSLSALIMPGPFQGYQLVDQNSGVVIAVVL